MGLRSALFVCLTAAAICFCADCSSLGSKSSPSALRLHRVVLPRSIDPSGRPSMLASGVEVYRFDALEVSYFDTENGRLVRHVEDYPDVSALTVSRTGDAVILNGPSGFKHIFPASATVRRNPNGYSLLFKWPNLPPPAGASGRKPDYIVP
jgi:hypothetical protein